MIIVFILGILSGFSLCCMFTYVAVKNRDDEIDLLNKKIDKYDSLLYYDETICKEGRLVMEAKEMFENIGYEIEWVLGKYISYIRKTNGIEKTITFINRGSCKFITIIEGDKHNPLIDFDELQAINKQVEELGWNE